MTTRPPPCRSPGSAAARRSGWPRVGLHVVPHLHALLWLAPVVWALYTSLRPYSDTAENGYVSLPETITLDNYTNAWTQGDIPHTS